LTDIDTGVQTIFPVLLFSFVLSADNLEKTQKKELETQVNQNTK
jgi:hypothetical protein